MKYSLYYKPVTLLLFMFVCVFISMLLCVLTTTLYPQVYATEFLTFIQPDGTPVELKVYGDDFCIKAETPDGIMVVRDARTGWICYAILNKNQDSFISTGIPYIPGIAFQQQDTESSRLSYSGAWNHNLSTSTILLMNQ